MIAGPIPAIRDLPERVLIDLAQALRAGRLTAATAFTVRFAVPAVSEAAELSSLLASGLGQQHAALLLDALAGRGEARKGIRRYEVFMRF